MSPRRPKLPGVKAIVTGADCDKTFGVLPIARNEYPLARDKVRYRGEPVAAVAAVDDATAARRVAPDQDEGARAAGLFQGRRRARARMPSQLHAKKPGNIERDVLFELGNVAEAFAAGRSGARGAPTTAPRSARTRWRCTRRSPTTMPSATA